MDSSCLKYFNSHPHIEDDMLMFIESLLLLNFNSHPHIEDDEVLKVGDALMFISIHILI